MKWLKYSLFLCCICLFFSIQGKTQTAVTSLHGQVTDPSGALIPGAHVKILETQNGYKAERTANDHGEYSFEQISPGHYTVEASSAGFGSQKAAVELLVNQPRTINFKMTLDSAVNTVEVDAS